MKLLLLSELVHGKTLQEEAGSENVCALNTYISLRNVAEKIHKSLRSSVLSTSQNVVTLFQSPEKAQTLKKMTPCVASAPVQWFVMNDIFSSQPCQTPQ